MLSYRPEELFDADGVPAASIVDWLPRGELRMSANPHTNGGRHPRDLELPDFRDHGVKAGETAELPVSFFVDPAIMDDPDTASIATITLSYTFYPADKPKSVSQAPQPAPTTAN